MPLKPSASHPASALLALAALAGCAASLSVPDARTVDEALQHFEAQGFFGEKNLFGQ